MSQSVFYYHTLKTKPEPSKIHMPKVRTKQIDHQHKLWSNHTLRIVDTIDPDQDPNTPFMKYLYQFGLVHVVQEKRLDDVFSCISNVYFLRHMLNQYSNTSEPLKFIRIVGVNDVDDVYASMTLDAFIPLDEERLDQLHDVGKFLRTANLYKGARNILSWTTEECHKEQYPSTEKTIEVDYAFGLLLKQLGEYTKSKTLLAKVLQQQKDRLGETHLNVLTVMESIASIESTLGNKRNALTQYEFTLFHKEKQLEEEETILTTKALIANIQKDLGEYEISEQSLLFIRNRRADLLGPEHSDTLNTIYSLANLYKTMSRYDEAEQLYLDVLKGNSQVPSFRVHHAKYISYASSRTGWILQIARSI